MQFKKTTRFFNLHHNVSINRSSIDPRCVVTCLTYDWNESLISKPIPKPTPISISTPELPDIDRYIDMIFCWLLIAHIQKICVVY